MNLRKALLATMLWSLGLAAVAGVAAALLGPAQIAWNLGGVALMTGAATGLLLASGHMLDRERANAAGLLAMTAVIAMYLLGLLALWQSTLNVSGAYTIVQTMLAIGGAAPLAIFYLILIKSPPSAPAGWVGLTSCIAAFVLALLGAWNPSATSGRWWESAAAIGGFGLVAVLCVVGMPFGTWSWRWLGILGSTAAAGAVLIGIWISPSGDWWEPAAAFGGFGLVAVLCVAGMPFGTWYWRWAAILISTAVAGAVLIAILITPSGESLIFRILAGLAAVIAHANLSSQCPLRGHQHWIRVATILSVIIVACLAALYNSPDLVSPNDFMERGLMAAGIAAGCGSLALVILVSINRGAQP